MLLDRGYGLLEGIDTLQRLKELRREGVNEQARLVAPLET